jgi:hypothetical protein
MEFDFEVSNTRPRYLQSREQGIHGGQPVKVGIQSADVKCNRCSHAWHDSNVKNALGGLVFTCPSCRVCGSAPIQRV